MDNEQLAALEQILDALERIEVAVKALDPNSPYPRNAIQAHDRALAALDDRITALESQHKNEDERE